MRRKVNSIMFFCSNICVINFAVDPGWNDPPMVNYSPSNPPPKSRISNKRVAFPVGPRPSSNASAQLLFEESPGEPNEANLDVDHLQSTLSNFDELLKLSPNDNVQLKVQLMKNMWKSGQFSCVLKNDIRELSDYLMKKDFENANKLHLKIFMNSPSECKTWISAMQYFINNLSK
ncbi:hypothetical protein WA026_008965 [Henosepilachna vigintioctopunctata]|uniref:SRA1/Sec31 domain-containing protein n=1 Tax=Henosepilachna vigintioctopunctata TaxID=420089 RepID=A0AAW1VDU7_9CUCU